MTSSDSEIVTHSESVTVIYSTPTISLLDYLMHPVPSTNTVTTHTILKRYFPQARFLTSDENLAMLEERENAKKEALSENKKKKMKRSQNKQKRVNFAEKEDRELEKNKKATRENQSLIN